MSTGQLPAAAVAGWLREAGFGLDAQWLLDVDTDLPGAIHFARRR